MKQLTKLWTQLDNCLSDMGCSEDFTNEIYKQFDEIFDLKDVYEYKRAMSSDICSPSEFINISNAMRRALVEGYLLAQMEQRKQDIKALYNCYRQDMEDKDEKTFNVNKYPNLVRASNSLSRCSNNT